MKDCAFCRIASGNLPAHFVYNDDLVFAIMSLEQPNPYKVLVIPRSHVETIYDLNDEQASAIFKTTVRLARVIRDVSKCAGMNLVQSNGKDGQQDVFHFHLHIVPRFVGDKIVLRWDNTPVPPEKLSQFASELRARLQDAMSN